MLGALGVILGLVLLALMGYFSVLNQTPITVNLWPGLSPRSAFIWEIAVYAAMTGWLVATLFWLAPALAAQRRYGQVRRRLRELEAKLQAGHASLTETPRSAIENGLEAPTAPLGRAVRAHADEEPV